MCQIAGFPWMRWIVIALGLAFLPGTEALAQFERYEVGRRLRLFETRWDNAPNPEVQARATDFMVEAVNAYFGMRLKQVAQHVTRANQALDFPANVPTDRQWTDALGLDLERRLLDAETDSLIARLRTVYASEAIPSSTTRVRLSWGPPSTSETVLETSFSPERLPLEISIPVGNRTHGDSTLRTDLLVADQILASIDQTVSFVDSPGPRLQRAQRAIDVWPIEVRRTCTERETARSLLILLNSLYEGRTLETDINAASLLEELEAIIGAVNRDERFHTIDRPGSFRVTLATETGRSVPARLLVPEGLRADAPVPLVIAMHGAGGTENLFFEAYGHGKIVDMCRERGWLLVAPRVGAFSFVPPVEIIDCLAAMYPVDRGRVFLVGHSMGGMMAVNALNQSPGQFAGVALLGATGRLTDEGAKAPVPVFVGVGTRDFALSRAEPLADSFRNAGFQEVIERTYPNIEHLMIVQAALPDVFRMFDSLANQSGLKR